MLVAALVSLGAFTVVGQDATSAPQSIALHVDAGAFEGLDTWPLGAGVPLPRGSVTAADGLRLRAEKQGYVPAQIETRTRWPDGSVKWIWVDFQGDPADRYFLELAGGRSAMPPPRPRLTVTETAESLSVNTGAMEAAWDRRYGSPTGIAVGERMMRGDGRGIHVTDSRGRRAALGGDGAELSWDVEANGPVRAVIRVEGWYVTEAGEQVARAVVRYHLYAGRAFFTMDHTFVFTRDTDELWFKEVAVRFPWQGDASSRARFGLGEDDEAAVGIGGEDQEAWVFQDDYPHFAQARSHFSVGRRAGEKEAIGRQGQVAAGWCEASDGTSGITVAVRDFAPQFPKELSADRQGVTARLWSNRGGKELDYRPATLATDYYGDWIAGIRRNVPGGHGVVVGVDEAGFRKLNPTGLGSARTHHIFCGYHARRPDTPLSQRWGAAFEKPPLALADPAWLCSSGVFWPIAARDEKRFPDAERFISTYFDYWRIRLQEFPMTGWISHGVGPELAYERRENGKLYASFYRLNNVAAYNTPKNVWVAYLRSGDRKYLDFAGPYTRFLADFKTIHWSGGRAKKERGLVAVGGDVHLPFYWALPGRWDTGGQSTDYLAPFRIGYLLRDMRWAADALERYTDAMNRLWKLETARTFNAPFTHLSMMVNAYRVTQDPDLAKKIHTLAGALIDLNDPLGFSLKFGTSTSQWARTTYKPDRKIMALLDYYDTFGVEKAKQAVLKANEELFTRACAKKPLSYQNVTPMYLLRCYEWTGNRNYRAAAVAQLRSALDWFREFEALPEEQKLPVESLSAFKPDKQGFPFFAVPHVLAHLENDTFADEEVFPYHANLGRDEECPLHVMKQAGKPLELLVQVITLRGELYPEGVPCSVTGPDGTELGAAVERAPSGAYRIAIPGESPAGCYEVSSGANRFLVIGSTAEKMVLSFPNGTYFGHRDGVGLAMTRARPYYFQVPEGQASFSLKVSRPIRLFDPAGREIEETADKTGKLVVSTRGRSGLWSFLPGPAAFMRFEDLTPVVAFGDSKRFFLPPGVPRAEPEAEWTPPQEDGLADGRFGGGLHVPGKIYRARWETLPAAKSFPFPEGTIACFIRTDWSNRWEPERSLQSFWTAPPFYLGYRNQPQNAQSGMFLTWLQFHPRGESGKGWLYRTESFASFKAGEWHHLACTWRKDPVRYVLYLDGKKLGELTEPPPAGSEDARGNGVFTLGPLRATFDELRISKVVRYADDFTPPDRAFTENADTVLLFHFDGDLRNAGPGPTVEFNQQGAS
ncbi:MAG: hypothetical protein ACE5JM_01675 [Armatimonadota bacterium]